MENSITIIGGGLAGCEAAWQAAKRGLSVTLYEMKPCRYSPAHVSPDLAELVCSNSLRSNSLENAVGLLKEELRRLDSLIMAVAEETRVPAGDALAVDRQSFSARITSRLQGREKIKIIREEVCKIPSDGIVIIASGPLTSPALAEAMKVLTGEEYLYFYDAIAPIVEGESLNMDVVFRASRYGEGHDYLNCPMTSVEYYRFIDELGKGEKVPYREFERPVHFEGCLPVEEMAERGRETLAHGPLKPVGLKDPRTGRIPYAVVQLRHENREGTTFNLVGFQTKLKWKEQERIFRMIPGLEKAVFLRFGSLHRNTFIHSPTLLDKTLMFKNKLSPLTLPPRSGLNDSPASREESARAGTAVVPTLSYRHPTTGGEGKYIGERAKLRGIFFAGQITGVEGYVESTSMGFLAGINAANLMLGKPLVIPPATTAIGSLLQHITDSEAGEFQPMNVNFGLFPSLEKPLRGRDKRRAKSERALKDLEEWKRIELAADERR